MEILPNDCIEIGDHRYRYLKSVRDFVYVVDIDDRTGLPKRWGQKELRELAQAKRIKRLDDKMLPVRPHTESLQDRARGEMRYQHVRALVADPGVWDKATRGQVIREYAKHVGKSKDALLDWLRDFWQGGQCRDAVMGNYNQCGKVTKSTPGAIAIHIKEEGQDVVKWLSGAVTARGKKPVSLSRSKTDEPRYDRYPLKEDQKLEIARVAWLHYGSAEFKSMDGAVTRVLAELYIERDSNGNALFDADGDPILLPLGRRPTEHQIYEILRQTKSLSDALKARIGEAEYNNDIKPRVGRVEDDSNGPGDVYEIDATILDVHIVDKATRQSIIGKPTFYLVLDRSSRLIVGWHVGLDNPSWSEAKLAIMNIAADWRVLAKRLKVKIKGTDMIQRERFPNRFVADRGNDLLHKGSERLCDGMEIQVTQTRALSSVSKAIVESHFRSVPTALRDFAPGYEPPEDLGERRVEAHSEGAAMTLDALRKVLMQIVIAHNRMPMDGYKASPKEIFLKQSLTPLAIWQRGIENVTAQGSRYPYNYVRAQLMSRDTADVLTTGFKFGLCYYDSPEIREWRVKAVARGGFSVKVSYESSCVNEIIVHDYQDTSKSFIATQIDPQWNNWSFAERYAAYRQDMHNKLLAKETAQGIRVVRYLANDEVFQAEKAATAAANCETTYGSRQSSGKAALEGERKDRRLELHELQGPEEVLTPERALAQAVASAAVEANKPVASAAEDETHSVGKLVQSDGTPPRELRDAQSASSATTKSPGKTEPPTPRCPDLAPEIGLGSNFDVSAAGDDILEALLNDRIALDEEQFDEFDDVDMDDDPENPDRPSRMQRAAEREDMQ